MKPTAIILGGTAPHAELCRLLKTRGYHTVLVDYLDSPPAKRAADEHVKESTLDCDAVYRVALEKKADLVIATCIDQANVTACEVMTRLGKPPPYSLETALSVSNKIIMKKIMIEHGIPTSRFVQASDPETVDFSGLRFPLIVKPCDSNGSKGVRRCDTPDEVSLYLPEALSCSRSGEAVIEEFVDGREIAFDSYVSEGKAHIVITRERRKISSASNDVQQIFGSFWPASLTSETEERLAKIANQVVSAFRLNNTPLMLQAILKDGDIHVIEFAPRIGGGENYRIIKMATGVDLVDAAIDSFVGRVPAIAPNDARGVILDNYLYAKPGVFGCIEGLERLCAERQIETFQIYKSKGDIISRGMSSSNRIAAFTVKGSSEQVGLEMLRRAMQNVEIYDIDGRPIMIRDIYGDSL